MNAGKPIELNSYRGPDGKAVQRMFAGIAHRYDFLNHFLSVSIDKRWRKLAVAKVRELMTAVKAPVCLDLCSGTGDLAIEMHRGLKAPVIASDFCHPMLTRSNSKIERLGLRKDILVAEADALHLPFPSAAFDVVTIAFGLRNLEDTTSGLSEIFRMLKPGGAIVILEFSRPVVPVLREAFTFYFRNVLPRLGALISGQNSAYEYLPESVGKFPAQDQLAAMVQAVGFVEVGYRNLTGGIAALHWGIRGSYEQPANRSNL